MKTLVSLVLLLLAIVGSPTMAQTTIPAKVQLNWTLPTTNTDGTTIPATGPLALAKVQVWLSTSTIPATTTAAPTVEVTPVGLTTTQPLTAAVGATVFARIKFCNATNCSVISNEATGVVTAPTPGMPAGALAPITIQF